MNKIYKVIWSKAKHTYVVTSEVKSRFVCKLIFPSEYK